MRFKDDEEMITAISSKGAELNSEVSQVFGRAPYFIIINNDKVNAIRNEGLTMRGGAGSNAVKLIAEQGAEILITGNVGPKAMSVLRQFNIKVYKATGTVKQAINSLKNKELEEII